MSDQQDVIPASSTGNNGANASDSPTDGKQSQAVPYDRFHEVVQQKNAMQEQLTELADIVAELKSGAQSKQLESTEEEIPDYYDDPKGFAEYIKNKAVEEATGRIKSEQQKIADEEKAIEVQFSQLKKEHGSVDEEKVALFAEQYGIFDRETGRYNLIAAYELMQSMEGGSKHKAPINGKAPTGNTAGIGLSQEQLRKTPMHALTSLLSKR